MKFSPHELFVIERALGIAADRYKGDAVIAREAATLAHEQADGDRAAAGYERIAAQFDKQAREADALQARIVEES
jgi:hypothetical protein